ncbi:hypothetical protein C0Q70_17267 [Pomacea canaliculata]|uniref:C-type lectin domain-containing protein n=1 Tax=Pomacea canaliculata TaxID=400727 RepID=A0A2T7NS41_POMCA|nr:hypothetical protein C0Q70_17267 [Pomacea canaliculata]
MATTVHPGWHPCRQHGTKIMIGRHGPHDGSLSDHPSYPVAKNRNNENCSTESAGMSSCYTVSTTKTNYREAQETCLADGANLLSIGSAKELLQVREEMKRRERESHWWVGLRKNMSSNNTWKWLEEPPSLTPLVILWDVNQPDNTRNMENCAEMLTSGFMNDVDCFNNRPYICEKHINHTRDSKNCETGWILISSSCYKLSVEDMVWSDAEASCNADGADMLSINSIDELYSLPLE